MRLQRERFGPEFRIPSKHRLHVAGDLVGDVLKKFGLESSAHVAAIQKSWVDIAGKDNAAHSSVGKLENGTLIIYVNHHLWLNEMRKVASTSLLKRLQERFGKKAIKRLKFEITPEEEF